MPTELTGIVHGRTIELDKEPGLPDGRQVTVRLTPASKAIPPTSEEARQRLRSAAGGWSDDIEGLDKYLEWNREQRKASRPELEP